MVLPSIGAAAPAWIGTHALAAIPLAAGAADSPTGSAESLRAQRKAPSTIERLAAQPKASVVYSGRKGHGTMHEFKIGQYVYYVARNRFKKEGRYVVMRLLPRGTKGGPHYIIRSQDDQESEYTAEASELRRVPGGR